MSAVSCLFSLAFPSLEAPSWDPISASASLVIALLHSPSIKLKCEQNVSENNNEIKSRLLGFAGYLTSSLSLVAFLRAGFCWSPCRGSGPSDQQLRSHFSAARARGTAFYRPWMWPAGPTGRAGNTPRPRQWPRRCGAGSGAGGGWPAWSPLASLLFIWVQFNRCG